MHKMKRTGLKRVDNSMKIFDITINGTRKSQVLSKIWLQRKEMLHVATVNSEYIMETRSNPRFKEILAQCLCVADGWGVVCAHKILNHKFSNSPMERINGVAIVEEILKHASQRGEKVFLLGAGRGVAELAAREMKRKYPRAEISWYEGARTIRLEQSEEASMTIAKINSVEPDYLLVAYGSPWQDSWIEENRPYLRVRVALGVGGVIDEWAGVVKACPGWIDRLGLKWGWRVVHEPWRWRRVLKVWQFGGLVLWHRLKDNRLI